MLVLILYFTFLCIQAIHWSSHISIQLLKSLYINIILHIYCLNNSLNRLTVSWAAHKYFPIFACDNKFWNAEKQRFNRRQGYDELRTRLWRGYQSTRFQHPKIMGFSIRPPCVFHLFRVTSCKNSRLTVGAPQVNVVSKMNWNMSVEGLVDSHYHTK